MGTLVDPDVRYHASWLESVGEFAGARRDDAALGQEGQRLLVEAEAPQGPQRATHARHDAVASSAGQAAPEELEDRVPLRRPRLQGRAEHGQLVLVGQQGRRGGLAGAEAGAPRGDGRPLSAQDRTSLKLLGLGADADRMALRKRYSELVRRFHPDRNGGDRSREGELQRVIAAYQQLKGAPVFA